MLKGVRTLTEEKNTNQNVEETEENDDLKVVMPEPNRVTMDAEEYKEQPEYLKVFANFYIAHFDSRDLEIMNLYDTNHNIVDINHYLMDNIHFPRKTLVKHVLQYHDYNFKNLLDEMKKQENIDPESFSTFEDWDEWYEKRRSEIQSALS